MSKRILILVIAYNQEPYISLERNGCRQTWASSTHPNIDILFIHSLNNINESHRNGSNLYVKGNEGLFNIGHKTLDAFKYCVNNIEFDYIYRTNLSSYIDQNELYNHVSELPTTNIYKGAIGVHNGIKFASGSGYLISKDLVEYVINNEQYWDHESLIDDVSIAQVLARNNTYPQHTNRIDILTDDALNTFDATKINKCFHFRCKSDTDRNHDIKTMHMLHTYFNNIENK